MGRVTWLGRAGQTGAQLTGCSECVHSARAMCPGKGATASCQVGRFQQQLPIHSIHTAHRVLQRPFPAPLRAGLISAGPDQGASLACLSSLQPGACVPAADTGAHPLSHSPHTQATPPLHLGHTMFPEESGQKGGVRTREGGDS